MYSHVTMYNQNESISAISSTDAQERAWHASRARPGSEAEMSGELQMAQPAGGAGLQPQDIPSISGLMPLLPSITGLKRSRPTSEMGWTCLIFPMFLDYGPPGL